MTGISTNSNQSLEDSLESERYCLPASFNFKPGTIISGKYALSEMLGYGGGGVVYKARSILSSTENEEVALKFPGIRDHEFKRLVQEQPLLKILLSNQFGHKNIVRISDFGSHEQMPYLVMEFIDGTDLRSIIDKEDLTIDEALRILIEVTNAIKYAHEQGIIHRDLKPANIMRDKMGNIKVTDFGLAKNGNLESAVLLSGQLSDTSLVGTPWYIAPEKDKGPKADVYSIGVLLFELFAKRKPDLSGTLPSDINITVPAGIDALYRKCIAFDPDNRISIGKLGDSLNDIRTQLEERRKNIEEEVRIREEQKRLEETRKAEEKRQAELKKAREEQKRLEEIRQVEKKQIEKTRKAEPKKVQESEQTSKEKLILEKLASEFHTKYRGLHRSGEHRCGKNSGVYWYSNPQGTLISCYIQKKHLQEETIMIKNGKIEFWEPINQQQDYIAALQRIIKQKDAPDLLETVLDCLFS